MKVSTIAALIFLIWFPAAAQDPAKVDSDHIRLSTRTRPFVYFVSPMVPARSRSCMNTRLPRALSF